jgi:hypothetical protein
LPFVLTVWTIAGFAPALIVRSDAYSGRFAIHVVGSTVAVLTCAIAALMARRELTAPSSSERLEDQAAG